MLTTILLYIFIHTYLHMYIHVRIHNPQQYFNPGQHCSIQGHILILFAIAYCMLLDRQRNPIQWLLLQQFLGQKICTIGLLAFFLLKKIAEPICKKYFYGSTRYVLHTSTEYYPGRAVGFCRLNEAKCYDILGLTKQVPDIIEVPARLVGNNS